MYLTENSPAISMVAREGLLAPVADRTLEQVPEQYRPSSGDWVGIAARSAVFVYNKDTVDEAELPTSFADLASPRWKGKWGAAPAGADFQAIVSASLDLSGEDATRTWLESLEGPDGTFATYKGNKPILAAVNAGEIDGGVIYHYYYFGDQAGTGESSQNVGQHYFRNGGPESFVSLSGGGVLAGAPHAEDAQRFLEFITSAKGQEILRDRRGSRRRLGRVPSTASQPTTRRPARAYRRRPDPVRIRPAGQSPARPGGGRGRRGAGGADRGVPRGHDAGVRRGPAGRDRRTPRRSVGLGGRCDGARARSRSGRRHVHARRGRQGAQHPPRHRRRGRGRRGRRRGER
ncbi:hypothetical protein NCCP2495_33370 [Dietzia sp. NCCP-2495]|nr:hypothetical protein NCCP2495_33370 [Dietzia sp. NCCP-2495]